MTMVNAVFSIVVAICIAIFIVASIMEITNTSPGSLVHFIFAPYVERCRIRHIKDTGELWMSLDQLISFSQAYPKKWELSTLDSFGYALYFAQEKNCSGTKIYLRRRDIKKYCKMVKAQASEAKKIVAIKQTMGTLDALMQDAASMVDSSTLAKKRAAKEQKEILERWVTEHQRVPVSLTLDSL